MRPSRLLLLSFLAAGSLIAVPLPFAAAGDDPPQDKPPAEKPPADDKEPPKKDEAPKPDADAEAAKFIEELRPKIGKQVEDEGKASVAKLIAIWKDANVSEETKKPVPDLLERYTRKGEFTSVSFAAIQAMAELPPEVGAKSLRTVIERELKSKEPSVEVYAECLHGLKKLADPSKATVDLLVELLKRKEDEFIGKAADAMSGYKSAPGKVRKELMEEVLKIGESAFQGSRDGKNSALVAKWNAIKSGVMSALQALSGQNFADPTVARAWFNDHKKDAKTWS